MHYVSPSVWAWRRGRIKNIKRSVDLMLTLFPFEAQFYKITMCQFVTLGILLPTGFHWLTIVAKAELGDTFDNDIVVAVLPGSRNSEIKRMTPVYLSAVYSACLLAKC